MIVDKIKNLHLYKNVNPQIEKIIKFLENVDFEKLNNGKNEIDGSNLWVLKEEYIPRPLSECYFERHQNYADIQLVLEGSEYIGYHNIDNQGMVITDPYNELKDVEKAQIDSFDKVTLNDGMFALVLPDDWHMPKLNCGNQGLVKKLVFKLKV